MPEGQIQTTEKVTAPFVLSLLAGLWMVSAGGMMGAFGWSMMGHGQGMYSWIGGQGMHAFGMSWPWFGILAGIVVLAGAVMLYVRPEQRRNWGLLVLVASALNVFVGIGGILAGALGIVGGVLALAAKA